MAEGDLQLKVVFDTSSLKGLGINTNGGAGNLKGTVDIKDGLKGVTGAITKGNILSAGILSGLKAFGSKLVESSPNLQKSLEVLNKSVKLLLRPIGDLLDAFLRPLSLAFLRFAIPFYKKSLAALESTGGKVGGAVGAIGGAIGGASAGAAAGGAIAGPAGALAGGAIGGIAGGVAGGLLGINLGDAVEKGMDKVRSALDIGQEAGEMQNNFLLFWDEINRAFSIEWPATAADAKESWNNFKKVIEGFFDSDPFHLDAMKAGFNEIQNNTTLWIDGLNEAFGTNFPATFADLQESWNNFSLVAKEAATMVWEDITKFFGETLPNIFSSFGQGVVTFFTDTLPSSLKKAWEGLKSFFGSTVPGWVKQGFDGLRTFFTETVPGWFSSLYDKLKNMFSSKDSKNTTAASSSSGTTKKGDFIIRPGGQVTEFSSDDTVIGMKKPDDLFGGGGGSGKIVVNFSPVIQALDPSSISSSTMDRIFRELEFRLKSTLSGRTSQGMGLM